MDISSLAGPGRSRVDKRFRYVKVLFKRVKENGYFPLSPADALKFDKVLVTK